MLMILRQVFYSYLLGALFLHDRITPLGLLGVALILAGVLLVTARPAKRSTPRPAAAAAEAAQPSAPASFAAAAAMEGAAGQRQASSLMPSLRRRSSTKASASMMQPLLMQLSDVSAPHTAASGGGGDSAVVVTAAGTALPLLRAGSAPSAAAAAGAGAGSGGLHDVDNATPRHKKPGVLSSFVHAALQSATCDEGAGRAVAGECCSWFVAAGVPSTEALASRDLIRKDCSSRCTLWCTA